MEDESVLGNVQHECTRKAVCMQYCGNPLNDFTNGSKKRLSSTKFSGNCLSGFCASFQYIPKIWECTEGPEFIVARARVLLSQFAWLKTWPEMLGFSGDKAVLMPSREENCAGNWRYIHLQSFAGLWRMHNFISTLAMPVWQNDPRRNSPCRGCAVSAEVYS